MPNYRFTVMGKDGKIRRGKLSAETVAAALQKISAQGFKLIDLEDLAENSPSYKVAPESFRGLSFDPPEQTQYRPSWLERLQAWRPTDTTLWGVVISATVLAIVLLVLGRPWATKPSSTPPASSNLVQVRGKLSKTPAPGTRLALNLPTIPLRQFYETSDVVAADGSYELKLEFRSYRQPTTAEVLLLSQDSTLARSGSFTLQGSPAQGRVPDLHP